MAASGVIFVGPSLGQTRPAHDGLEYRPPAARGDLIAAARGGARVIGLVDGVFHQDLAVTPREVREVAAMGMRLFGGASMGALRAVECPEAMTGVGEIFDAFARGELTDDDEVAVTFIPGTYEVISHPLVQVRAAAAIASPDESDRAARLIECVRSLPFQERTLAAIRRCAVQCEPRGQFADAMAEALAHEAADVKRRDALQVVAAVRCAIDGLA